MPVLTERALFMRSIVDDMLIVAQSTFVVDAPATRVNYQRPKSRARSTDTSAASPAFFTIDTGGDVQKCVEAYQVDITGPTFLPVVDEFNSAAAADCSPLPASPAVGDYFAFGMDAPPSHFSIDVGTAAVGTGVIQWEYYNSAGAWAALSGVSDGTNSFKTTGANNVTFTAPLDLAKVALNSGETLYYFRATLISGSFSTDPVLDEGDMISSLFDPVSLFMGLLFVSHDGIPGSLKWRIRFDEIAAMTSPNVDSGTRSFDRPVNGRNYSHATYNPYDTDTTIAPSRYMRIDIWATEANWIDVGRYMCGEPIQPVIAPLKSTSPTPIEQPRKLSGSRGEMWSIPGITFLQANGTIMSQSREESEKTFNELFERQGVSRDLLYLHLPGETGYLQQHLMQCRFDTLVPNQLSAPGDSQIRYQISGVR